eukprot:PhF_6_TR30533/c0_g1_i1/m.44786
MTNMILLFQFYNDGGKMVGERSAGVQDPVGGGSMFAGIGGQIPRFATPAGDVVDFSILPIPTNVLLSDGNKAKQQKLMYGGTKPPTPSDTVKQVEALPTVAFTAAPTPSPSLNIPTNSPVITPEPTINYDEAIKRWVSFLSVNLTEKLEQSSNYFIDIHEQKGEGIEIPMEEGLDRFQQTKDGLSDVTNPLPCDPSNADFTPDRDEKCCEYLRDLRNIKSVKVMSSILDTGRTIKFRVFYKHLNLQAIMKVPQKKFYYEPGSEVLAFHTDRALALNRVPPTAWVMFPIDWLKAAAALHDAFYCRWLLQFVFEYQHVRPLIKDGSYLGISLQIWMFDVHYAEETILQPIHNVQSYFHARMTHKWANFSTMKNRTIWEMSNMYIFDFIIGNTDRGMGHNLFVFGGCDPTKADTPCPDAAHTQKATPRIAMIDQGSSFYHRDAPKKNPYNKKTHALCRFERTMAEKLLELKGKTLLEQVKARIKKNRDSGVWALTDEVNMKEAQLRLDKLATDVDHCIEHYGKETTFFFEKQ